MKKVLLTTFLSLAVNTAMAKDLDGLAKLVVPAYTAMNFAMMCARAEPTFPTRMGGPRGNVLEYAQHVKDEVIVRLNQGEANVVLKAAADVARDVARGQLKLLAKGRDVIAPSDIAAWCTGPATDFIRGFIASHDRDHSVIEASIEEASR